MLGIGLIGLGKHGSRHARHIVEELPDATLVAVRRRNRPEGEQLAAASGCAFYDDYRDLVASPRVDAVVVAVPPTLHPAIVDAACQAGKALLIEKPLATSLAEAQHIASMVSASGVRAMVAHTLRFNSTVRTVQAHVPEIGPLHACYLSQPTVRETLNAFVRALREGTPFPISIEDGLRAVAIADAAYRSVECGGESAAVAGGTGG